MSRPTPTAGPDARRRSQSHSPAAHWPAAHSPAGPQPAERPWIVALLLGLVTLAVFLPVVRCGFVNWDDGPYVTRNPLVLDGLSAEGVRRACTEVVFGNWAPLTILSYQLDVSLFGRDPWGFHLTNAVLHAASTALLYLVLVRMTGAPGRSGFATLLFAVHPLRVESVAWIAERKDVASVLFLMLALVAYERYCRAPSAGRLAAVAAAMLGSLLCKPTLVTLPVLLLLLDVWPLGRLELPGVGRPERFDGALPYPTRPWRLVLAEKLPLLGLSLLFVAITLRVQSAAILEEDAMPLVAERIPNAIHAVNWYVWKTFWPTGLCPFHRTVGGDLPLAVLGGCAASLVFAGAVAWKLARTRPFVAWGLLWFLVSLLPVLGLVQTGLQGAGDRFSYVPHVGLLVALVWAAADWAGRLRLPRGAAVAAAAAVVLLLAFLTLRRIPMWTDSETLWTTTLREDPGNFLAHLKFANHLVAARRLREAEPHYRAAAAGASDDWTGRVCRMTSLANLACLYYDLGDLENARKIRQLAIDLDPDDVAVRRMADHVRIPEAAAGAP